MTSHSTKIVINTLVTSVILCSILTPQLYAGEVHAHGDTKKHIEKDEDTKKLQSNKKDKHVDEHNNDHSDKHNDGHTDEHHEEGHIEMTHDNALKAGIVNQQATSGQINNITTVYGRSVIDASAVSQVRARFSGLITQLNVNVGDEVKTGELIATVESSASLKHYNIKAPISGVVTKRFANVGELAGEHPLITIENYEQLWVEYKIFPSQSHLIKKGQKVSISSSREQITSTIKHLMANKNNPFITARALINNPDGKWHPGQLLTGKIVTNQVNVNIVIDNRAFQEVEGKMVIFITNKGGYETREVEVGLTDGHYSEVLSGLELGEHYALINSYLLKADLGKAGASHSH
jgi:cobalt-zinc-cadmium efflux system membrane fusion protein